MKKEAVEAQKRVEEETDRVAKKKAAVRLEFDALQQPDVRVSLAKALEPVAAKHRGEIGPEGADESKAAAVEESIRKDCAAAIRDLARNFSEVIDTAFARGVIEGLKKRGSFNAVGVVNETISEVIGEGASFDFVWTSLFAPIVERPLREVQALAIAAQSRVDDAERAEKGAATGVPPGMIEVPEGEYEIGDSIEDFGAAKKLLGYTADRKLPTPYYGSPKKKAKLAAFFLEQNEVTNRHWAEFCRQTKTPPPPHWVRVDGAVPTPAESRPKSILPASGGVQPSAIADKAPEPGAGAPDSRPSTTVRQNAAQLPPPVAPVAGKAPARGTEDVPITYVTFDAMVEYCRWCGRRLPTEEEWEAAARRPAPGEKVLRRLFPFGDHFPRERAACNFAGAVTDPRITGQPRPKGGTGKDLPALTPVGSWPESKSALGFNDLAGNAIEVTSSPFVKYPGWAPENVPPGIPIRDDENFNEESVVMRGGQISSTDLMLMASVRRGFPRAGEGYSVVGFRTAQSKAKGKDLMDSLATVRGFQVKLSDTGRALKDEEKASRFPTLDYGNPAAYAARFSGGFDPEKNLPTKGSWIAALNRKTREFNDVVKVMSLAKDQKEPLLLGWLRVDAPVTKPPIPAGEYWVMWRNSVERDAATKKATTFNELALRSLETKEYFRIDGVKPLPVPASSEATTVSIDKAGTIATVILSFPINTSGKGRMIVEFKLEAEPGTFSSFK